MATTPQNDMSAKDYFNLAKCDGVPVPRALLHRVEALKSRDLRADDIILCTYPKSGTHWVWEILNMIVAGKPKYAEHWLNSSLLEYRTVEELDELESPRVLNTHLHPRLLPESTWIKKCKIVYVQRNPKDCLLSWYFQMINQDWSDKVRQQEVPSFTGTWDDFFNLSIDGAVPFGSWFDYVRDWNNITITHPEVEICRVQYEDLKKDSVKEIKKMAEYLERPLSDETYSEIADACSFQKLKQVSENVKDQTFHIKWKEGSSGYFRKGVVGDWKNWFTVAQNEKFDSIYEEKLGYKYCIYH